MVNCQEMKPFSTANQIWPFLGFDQSLLFCTDGHGNEDSVNKIVGVMK